MARLQGHTVRDKLILNSTISTDTGCWVWQRAKHATGYGVIRFNGKQHSTHRVSYEIFREPIPEGMEIDHLCRVRECINPWHMEVVTHAVNTNRGLSPPAINSRKTHCVHGHELTEENTFEQWTGGRGCRQCRKDRRERYRAEGRYGPKPRFHS